MTQLKRVYEKPSRNDGLRILVDRLWPRSSTKERGGEGDSQPAKRLYSMTGNPDIICETDH
jgi:uncharacterized protein YeaO (DUF488 family)